jgi:hypothetical protein
MPEITRWKIRPVAIGDIYRNTLELERRIIPVYAPILIGTLAGHLPENPGEWNYELLEIDEKTSNSLAKRMLKAKPGLEKTVNSAVFQTVLRINPARYRHISRFHAILGTKKGDLYIADLESKNRTYTGTEQTHSAILKDGQTIYLGGKAEDSAQIKVYEAIKKAYALLVGVDYKKESKKSVETSIKQMENLLKNLGIPYECKTLKHEQATKDAITTQLIRAESLPENSLFLFYCDTHGSRTAITPADKDISKKELSELLNRVKAKKIAIIDSCYADGGWEELDLESGFYFFSSQEQEKARWNTFSPRLAERISELLSRCSPVDIKQVRIQDLANGQTPIKKGNRSIILY